MMTPAMTRRAERELERVDRKWRKLRPAVSELLLEEFDAALTHLESTPQSGELLGERRGLPLRRWLLPKTQYHLYFTVDVTRQVLTIHSVWGARRGQPPQL